VTALLGWAVPAAADIKIAHVYDKTGALEAYAKQSHDGLMMGLEYATGGTMEVNGAKIVVIEKDSQLKPDLGRAMLAVALGREGVKIATLAQDYAFGRDGIAAFKEALAGTKAELVVEEYAPTDTTDFTAYAERIFNAMTDLPGEKRLFVIWAGAGNPMGKIQAMDPSRFGIEIATGGNILEALKAYKAFPGMEGATYYYYDIPKNPVNDWLVKEHMARFGTPPDFFTAGGMAAGIAAVEALKRPVPPIPKP